MNVKGAAAPLYAVRLFFLCKRRCVFQSGSDKDAVSGRDFTEFRKKCILKGIVGKGMTRHEEI